MVESSVARRALAPIVARLSLAPPPLRARQKIRTRNSPARPFSACQRPLRFAAERGVDVGGDGGALGDPFLLAAAAGPGEETGRDR